MRRRTKAGDFGSGIEKNKQTSKQKWKIIVVDDTTSLSCPIVPVCFWCGIDGHHRSKPLQHRYALFSPISFLLFVFFFFYFRRTRWETAVETKRAHRGEGICTVGIPAGIRDIVDGYGDLWTGGRGQRWTWQSASLFSRVQCRESRGGSGALRRGGRTVFRSGSEGARRRNSEVPRQY